MHHVRFAGLGLSWNQDYAQVFAKYLHEIGYLAKPLDIGKGYVVAYSHKQFSLIDVQANLDALLRSYKKEKESQAE